MRTPEPTGNEPKRSLSQRMIEDLDVVLSKDPAARSRAEVLLYPHIHALWTYRIANRFYRADRKFAARALSMVGRWLSGIEIHPGATIGRRFFIDHGSAVVIGETVHIGDDVMLYHQVTLGSVGWWRDLKRAPGERRHPIIEDGVIIGTNASVLGPVTIGAGSQIGAHVVVLESIPPGSRVNLAATSLVITDIVAKKGSGQIEPPVRPRARSTSAESPTTRGTARAMNTSARVIITSAPPNPNGDLHLGHLSGPFLGADVLRRYLRQVGHDVTYVGYSDAHSCYVPRRGSELGHSAYETAHVFGRRMEETLGLANMQHDYFTHPLRETLHTEVVQRFFLELWDKGAFEVAEFPVYWCSECERYLYEAEMRGLCQFCGEPSDGFYCEQCGRPQESAGLVEPKCTRCGKAPETRTIERIYFPLDNYRDRLREYYAGRPMRPALRAYLDDMLSEPLPVTPVSRVGDYGIPVPLADWAGNYLDTWYCGIFGYLAATVAHGRALGQGDAGLEAWQDPSTRVFEFIGFDCSFSHALLWAALFIAHGGLTLPDQIVTNEFYRLEGDKFSTSRGHAIWGNEFLRRVPADQLRFYLCLTGPEREQTNFFGKDFQETSQQLLVDGLQRWAAMVVSLVTQDFAGMVPATPPRADGPLAELLNVLPGQLSDALEPDDFSPQAAATVLRAAIECAVAEGAVLLGLRERGGERYAAELVLQVQALARIAAAAAPLMPGFAELVWTTLGLDYADSFHKVLPWPAGDGRIVPAGQEIRSVLPELFRPFAG